MPIYDYNCPHCYANFESFAKMKDSAKKKQCPFCKQFANKIPSIPSLVTDTNFCVAGVHHVGVCDPNDKSDVVIDRADWDRRLKQKGLRELDRAELTHPKKPQPRPCM